jgi:hypothetical protein
MEVGVGSMRYFGVKSYLDNFYDRQGEDEQHRYLFSFDRRKFSSRWWKLLLCFGSFLVLFGLFLLLIGFILPRKKINVDSTINSQIIIIDRKALSYNTNLDRSHLVGICLVVIGGILFTLSLLIPTFCHMWCASEDLRFIESKIKENFWFIKMNYSYFFIVENGCSK